MKRTRIGGWLRGGAAVAAVAAMHFAAPAAQAATPCSDPEGVVVSGQVAGQYVLLRYDQTATALKLCAQHAGAAGNPGYYGVVNIPLTGATVERPSVDEQAGYCTFWQGITLYHAETAEGRYRISTISSFNPSRAYLCLETPGMNRRLIVPIIPTVALPTVEQVQPAPSPGQSVPWPSAPSSSCDNDALNVLLPAGGGLRLSYETAADGKVDVCFRGQDGNGTGAGGKVSLNATAVPKVEAARNTTGCTILVIHQVFPGDVRIERGPNQSGAPFSICVTSPTTGTVRLTVTPAAGALAAFTPDP